VVTRLSYFLLSSALWLGRIDVEFLDPNVKFGGVSSRYEISRCVVFLCSDT
jgi:hypothetical protein